MNYIIDDNKPIVNNLDQLAPALAIAQGAIESAHMSKTNPAFKSKYADLGDINKVIKNPLSDNGLSLFTSCTKKENDLLVTTQLLHKSGQSIESSIIIPVSKPNAHGLGSALTYGRRYTISCLLNIVSDTDDDGNAAAATIKKETPTKVINPAQFKEIYDLIFETNTDPVKFCEAFGIKDVEYLPSGKFLMALTSLQKKRNKMKEGKNENK